MFEAKQKQKSRTINVFSKSNWLQASDKDVFISKYIEDVHPLGDIEVDEFTIYPPELAVGVWPSSFNLSDHGIISTIFKCNMLPRDYEESIINPNPIALKNK